MGCHPKCNEDSTVNEVEYKKIQYPGTGIKNRSIYAIVFDAAVLIGFDVLCHNEIDLAHGRSAVHAEHLPHNVFRNIRGQEDHGVGDILRLSPSAYRSLR